MKNQVNSIKADSGRACLIDPNGNILLEPQTDLDILYYPSYGVSLAKKDDRYGYINSSGDLIIPFNYKKAYPFSENGLAFVINDSDLGGYIDKNGEYVIPPTYDTGSRFQFGFAAVSRAGKYKFIHENGCKAIDGDFNYAGGFSKCGLAKYESLEGKQGFLDTRSRTIVELKRGCELFEFKDDSRITKFRADGREALIDAAGKIFTGFFEKVIISPYSLLNPFLRNDLWGYVDDLGNEVIPNIYREVTEFNEDKIARVKAFHPLAENQLWEFFINEKDEIIDDKIAKEKSRKLNEKFIHVNSFKKAMALVIKK